MGGGGGGLIFETNCIFEYKPSPHFRLDVVYKMGGVLTGHYGINSVYRKLSQLVTGPWECAMPCILTKVTKGFLKENKCM